MARGLGRAALDLVLPPSCLTCDQPVDAPGRLCADCFQRTGFVTEPCCARCGVPFTTPGRGGAARLCPACALDPGGFDRARAAFRYDAQARRMILPLKYGDRTELARALAVHMARAGAGLLREADVLVPVPLHRARLFRRRYNQAALLAYAIGRGADRAVVPDALRRVRATRPLGGRNAAARAAEVESAFAVRASRAERIAGARVLLIDDVLTTGATANACALALKQAGARRVDVLVAARVPDPRLD
jgi:ComF family protein